MKNLILAAILVVSQHISAQLADANQIKIDKIKNLSKSLTEHGLLYTWYFTPAVEAELLTALSTNNGTIIDARLNQLAHKMISDLSRGRILSSMSGGKSVIADKPYVLSGQVGQFLANQITESALIAAAIPKNVLYQKQLAVFQKVLNLKKSNTWPVKPEQLVLGVVSKKTVNSQLVQFLRNRLAAYGYSNDVTNPNYSEDLKNAAIQFQTDNKLGVDGVVGKQSWDLLGRSIDQLILSASVNLDRTRWLPDSLGSEFVYVNLARQELTYIQNNTVVLQFSTVNGRLDRQTPIMVDQIRYISLNPTWTVPRNIFVKDKVPLLRQDPGYVAQSNMILKSDINGLEVDPYTVDWNQDPSKLPYTLIQKPGPWNALGYIKFPLTNRFAIYLHDTNDRSLFSQSTRLFSSGCVRLQQPFELAEKLLANAKYTVDALKLQTELKMPYADKPTDIAMTRRVPVYLQYQTGITVADRIVIGSDPYELDKLMMAAIVQ